MSAHSVFIECKQEENFQLMAKQSDWPELLLKINIGIGLLLAKKKSAKTMWLGLGLTKDRNWPGTRTD